MPKRSFTLLLDVDDLAGVRAHREDALGGDVLTFDPDLHVGLQSEGVRHLTPWDIVGREEIGGLREMEAAVWGFWRAHGRAAFEGIDLLRIAEYRHMVCFSRLTWAAYVIGRVLETLRPGEVVTFEEKAGHGLDQPAEYRKMPLLFALVRGMAEQAGIPVTVLRRSDVGGTGGFEDQVAKAERADLERVDVREVLGDGPYVLFNASGGDLIRQLPLIAGIRRELGLDVVQLYKSADERTLRAVRQAGHYVWHESQVTGDTGALDVDELGDRARGALANAGRDAPAALRGIFDNPHMGMHFDFVFGEYLRKMAEHVRKWRGVFEECRPAMLVGNYHAPILDVARDERIPCLGLPHGLLMIGNERWFSSLPAIRIGAISELHRDRLVEAGVSERRIRVTGDPWLDPLVRRGPGRSGNYRDLVALRDRLAIDPERRVILIGTGNLGMPAKTTDLPYVDWAGAIRDFEALGELAGRRADWKFVLKCHPRFDHPAVYERVNARLPADRRITVLFDEPLELLAAMSDAVVFHNVMTSAMIETSLRDRPVMLLSGSMVWYSAKTWATQGWRHVASVESLEDELSAIFKDGRLYQQRVEETRAAVRHYYGGDPVPAVPRCLGVVREMMRETVCSVK
jgi:hypothetical protein